MRKFTAFLMGLCLLLAVAPAEVSAQKTKVKGVVVDNTQTPVLGATVLEVGTLNGTTTDQNGQFSLDVSSDKAMLEISFIGYTTVTIAAQGAMAQPIVLKEDLMSMEEVVVIGYGVVKKTDLTGSVSNVKADQLNKGVIASPSNMLIGKSAGVVVTQGDGQPGSSSTIRIRGGSSLSATNSPLIVVDGLPISNDGINGVSDQLSSINPNDIESFTVLKDASATAIYGSRASNGVIVITTKKGVQSESNMPTVSVDVTGSLSQNTKYLNVMTGDEVRAAVSELYPQAVSSLGSANTDWQKEIYRLAQSVEANASLSGSLKLGSKQYLPYRLSLGYLNQQGVLKTSSMERETFALNLNPKFFENHLTVNLNTKAMNIDNRFANSGAIGAATQYDPTKPVYDENGIGGYTAWKDASGTCNTMATQNPVAMLYDREDLANAKRFIGNAQLDYKIHGLEDLRLNLNLGLDYSKSSGTVDTPVGSEQSLHSTQQSGSGLHTDYNQLKRDQTLEFYADYAHSFGKHTIEAMAGYSWQHFFTSSYSADFRQSDGSNLGSPSPFATEYFLVSFFGRLNYNYDNRYLLTATYRADGTSRFANNKWGYFPSVAFSWNIANEKFLKDSPVVSALKLRLSYGQTGQQDLNAGNYPTLASYYTNKQGSWYQFGDQVIVPITPQGYNADLKWETTTTYNAGLDWGFLNGRIYGSFDVYKRITTDLLNYTPVSNMSNLKNYLSANIGTLENVGAEVEVNFVPVATKDWHWTVGVNGAWNKNKITKLTTNDGPDYKGVATGGISGGVGNTVQIHQVNYPTNTFYVYEQIYNEEGNPIEGAYVDRNNDNQISADDLYYYKKSAPDYTIGLNTTINYKSWTLAASAHSNIGNYVYNNNKANQELLTDLWTNSFVSNRVNTAMTTNFRTQAQYLSDYYIQDASFFKLDNITLSKHFLFGGVNLNVFGTVQNVLCITSYEGIDPEVYSGIDNNLYPRPRTYILGLKVNF